MIPDDAERLCALSVPAEPGALAGLRAAVRAVARRCGIADSVTMAIVLAVDEAGQNVIRHAYAGTASGPIDLTVWKARDDLWFVLRDYAPPVDPARIRPRPLDALRPGGLGTHFIRSVMDEVHYAPAPDGPGTLLHMRKRLGQPET